MEHINTLKAFDNLVASGVPADEARAQVEALNSAFDGVATKQDLADLESRLESKIDLTESKLEAKLDSKFNILFTIGGVMFLINTKPILDNIGTPQGMYLSYLAGIGLLLWSITSIAKRKK